MTRTTAHILEDLARQRQLMVLRRQSTAQIDWELRYAREAQSCHSK